MRWVGFIAWAATAGCSLIVSTGDLENGAVSASSSSGTIATATDAGGEAGPAPFVDSAKPREPNLVAAWLFDDGTARDSSGGGHDGTLEGATHFGDTDRGKVLLLGGGRMIVRALEGAAFPRSGTLSMWFKWTAMDPSVQHGIFDHWDRQRQHLFLRHANEAPAGDIQYALMPRADPYVVATGFSAPKDAWQHVVLTWDAVEEEAVLYVNGERVDRDPYTDPFAPTEQHVTFGDIDGAIDDIRLYDRAMPEEEALQLP